MTNLLTDSIIKSGDTYKNAVIFLHGYGANSNDLIGIANLWIESLPNTIFLSPNAPFECDFSPNAYQWFELTSISPDSIGDGLKKAGPYLNDYIDHVSKTFKVEEKNIFFVGFSQGTMLALHVVPRRDDEIAGLVAFSGRLLEPEALVDEVKCKPPVLLVHGDQDDVVPVQSLPSAVEGLQLAGFKDVFAHIMKGTGHGIAPDGLSVSLAFIRDKLGFL